MLGYTFFATFALIATFWHPLNCGAFRTAARAWSTRARTIPTMKLSAVEKAILAGSALHAWHDGWFDVFSPNNIKHLIAAKKKYDLLYKTIDNNDIEQLKTMAASFGQFDLRLALDYIVFRKGSLAALDALIPYARQAELDALCINSAHAKRKDILEHMINQGITIHDSTIDTVLSIAIAHDASDIFEYLYPLTTNISAALSAACMKGDVTLIQTMVARADDIAIDNAMWSTISHKHTLADLYQDDLEQITLDDTPSFYRALNRLQEYDELITKRKKIIEFLSKQTTNYPRALALACQQDDKETFTYLLPQCSNVISALRASVSKKGADLWYTRSILAHHKDKIPSEGLNMMIQNAVHYDDNSPQRAELINQYLPQVTDPLLLTDIFRKDPLKQLLFSTEQATSIALFSSFRGDNWVEKTVIKERTRKK